MEEWIDMDSAGVFVFGCLCQGGARNKSEAAIRGPQPAPPGMPRGDVYFNRLA
jgi:hypothetical protein